ncbi:hypothetical protein K2173_021233 [Erythroxylum novogranatense]|uniref:RING-type domain-containing protein n=1 Tax=Erythroxylum novogranatense TaxID=1862640 RepID=A0AAV8TQ10_9ROSI|nr:hypothetical protein K2173_021233 [Erythroxylum novogranatense]
MGGRNSKEETWRSDSSLRSDSSAWGQQAYSQPSYDPDSYNYSYAPQQSYGSSQQYYPYSQEHGSDRKRLDRKYSKIADEYKSLDQVTAALAHAGLESSNLIIGVDFTKSNEWTGAKSFNRRSLHHIGDGLNPYEQAISIIGKTLSVFDEDNLIPCFGFGDASTHDQDVFSFYPEGRCCNGFEEVLSRYREIVPHLRLAGPTSFAPIIEMAMTIVEQSGGQYHVLVIIADGQVTRSVDTESGRLSPQEQRTVQAIVEASKLPLSIILVGVGDGPWDTMKEFDDNIPTREFDNFQFVNFTEIMSKNSNASRKETEFALAALMEIPTQYKATMELNLLGHRKGIALQRVPLPPPVYGESSSSGSKPYHSSSSSAYYHSSSFKPSVPPYEGDSQPVSSAPPPISSLHDDQRVPLPPPVYGESSSSGSKPYHSSSSSAYYHSSSFKPSVPPYEGDSQPVSSAPPPISSLHDDQVCPVCLSNAKDMAFGCGHQTCCECGESLQLCPICRGPIEMRLKLY